MARQNTGAEAVSDEREFAERELAEEELENQDNLTEMDGNTSEDIEKSLKAEPQVGWDWTTDEQNPYNWPARKKWAQVAMISAIAFVSSLGSSIMAPATSQLMAEYDILFTAAIAPLSTYIFALGLGPIVGGPLSETVGRYPVFAIFTPLGLLFTLGTGFCNSFVGVCILRFLAGFAFAPSLAISTGVINETFLPEERGVPATLFILTPFLGPGMGPVIGSFVINRMGWRWTQWTMVFFTIAALIPTFTVGRETYHAILKKRRAQQLNQPTPPSPPLGAQLRAFVTIALLRPLSMMFTEPIVALICLYVACEFATLYSFFAAVPYVFRTVYHFSIEQSGLVFLSIVIGCVLGVLTIVICDVLFYRRQLPKHPPHMVPPEYRLLPAMIGSIGLPIGLFWFGWTARSDISWASPAVAIVPFAWGNICVFVSLIQYMVDAYHGTTIASAASANSLARYALGAAFPLFTLQMYERLGIDWASSLLGFIALVLMPVPWAFFKFGKQIRSKSRYETASY